AGAAAVGGGHRRHLPDCPLRAALRLRHRLSLDRAHAVEVPVIDAEITAWLLRAESTLLGHMLPVGFSWAGAVAPLSLAVGARRNTTPTVASISPARRWFSSVMRPRSSTV